VSSAKRGIVRVTDEEEIATKDVRPYVEQGIEFMNNNKPALVEVGELRERDALRRLFLRPHWPLFIFDPANDVCMATRTNTRRPRPDTGPTPSHVEFRSNGATPFMKELAQNGLTGSVRNIFRRAADIS